MDWIHLALDSYDYQVLENMVMNIVHFPLNYIIFIKNQYNLFYCIIYLLFSSPTCFGLTEKAIFRDTSITRATFVST